MADCLPRPRLRERISFCSRTVLRAARILRDNGVLHFYRGSGMFVTATRPQKPAPRPRRSAQRIYESLRREMLDGSRRSGEGLPKIDYLVRLHRVSPATVLKAYRLLATEELAHKEGKRWLAGKRPPKTWSQTSIRPVILVVLDREQTWRSLLLNKRVERFGRTFMQEAEKNMLESHFVTLGESSPLSTSPRQLQKTIRSLGDRYRGALVVAQAGNRALPAYARSAVGPFRKPLVWFDSQNTEPSSYALTPRFYRCYCSEQSVAECAIDSLLKAGHEYAALVDIVGHSWLRGRERFLRQAISKRNAPVRCIAARGFHALMSCVDEEALRRNCARLFARRPRFADVFSMFQANPPDRICVAVREELLERYGAGSPLIPLRLIERFGSQNLYSRPFDQYRHCAELVIATPVCTHLLAFPELSVWLCGNDAAAGRIHRWLRMAGIAVPDDLSLLSFDNAFLQQMQPISTIDFGYDYLGYSALHLLLGDIPVLRDRTGDIPSIAKLISRGSLRSRQFRKTGWGFRKLY